MCQDGDGVIEDFGRRRPFNYLYLSVLPKVREFIPRPISNFEPIELSHPE